MNIFPKPVAVTDEEGFSPEKDIFGRMILAEPLTNLLSNTANPIVVAVDGEWGSGKTTFLKMWAGELRKAGFPVIYIDAFENDYEPDPFTTIASRIIEIAAERSKTASDEFSTRAKSVARIVARSGLKIGVKALTLGALNAVDLDELASIAAGDVGEDVDSYLGAALTRSTQQKATIDEFRKSLSSLSHAIRPEVEVAKPVVIIVDELDRCRPDYALMLLERMKHFFSVDNVHFIISVHMPQLENSVRAAYGAELDAHLYLQKFIHLIFPLVDKARHDHERIAPKYISYLLKAIDLPCDDQGFRRALLDEINEKALRVNLSLRSIERLISNVALAIAGTSKRNFRPPHIIVALCLLRILRPAAFARAKRGILTYDEVAEVLCIPDGEEQRYERVWWQFLTGDENVADHEMFRSLRFDYHVDNGRGALLYLANSVVDNFQPV